jgi:hypothetical protein
VKEPKPQAPDADQDHLDQLLDDLYALQKNLLHDEFNKAQEPDLPETDTEADFDSLEIPILTQSLNREIDDERQSRKAFDEAQHILFENPDGQPAEDQTQINQEQVNAIVNRLMSKMRPKVEQLLREKIRAKVIERFNRQN